MPKDPPLTEDERANLDVIRQLIDDVKPADPRAMGADLCHLVATYDHLASLAENDEQLAELNELREEDTALICGWHDPERVGIVPMPRCQVMKVAQDLANAAGVMLGIGSDDDTSPTKQGKRAKVKTITYPPGAVEDFGDRLGDHLREVTQRLMTSLPVEALGALDLAQLFKVLTLWGHRWGIEFDGRAVADFTLYASELAERVAGYDGDRPDHPLQDSMTLLEAASYLDRLTKYLARVAHEQMVVASTIVIDVPSSGKSPQGGTDAKDPASTGAEQLGPGDWLMPPLSLKELGSLVGTSGDRVKVILKSFGLRNFPPDNRQSWTVNLHGMPEALRHQLRGKPKK